MSSCLGSSFKPFLSNKPPSPSYSSSSSNSSTMTSRSTVITMESEASSEIYGPVCHRNHQLTVQPYHLKKMARHSLNMGSLRKHRDYVLDPMVIEDHMVDYNVARYDPEIVSMGMAMRHSKYVSLEQAIFWSSTFTQSIFGITWKVLLLFLILYYSLQVPYQLYMFDRCDKASLLGGECHEIYQEVILEWKELEYSSTRYLTFILGFYVGQVIKRWWDQIQAIPEIDTVTNYMAGLVQTEGEGYDARAALGFMKQISRYCLLSWTMFYSSVSKPFQIKINSEEDYLKKELITPWELQALKVEGGSSDGWKDLWSTPMTWAICMVNAYKSHTGFKIKDNKDFIGILNKFYLQLEQASRYQYNPLPMIYGQAVIVAVHSWLILSIVASQELVRDGDRNIWAALFFNFPFFQCVKVLLIFGWMRLANILRNPFHTNQLLRTSDLDLAQKLDINIWKATVALKNIHQNPFDNNN